MIFDLDIIGLLIPWGAIGLGMVAVFAFWLGGVVGRGVTSGIGAVAILFLIALSVGFGILPVTFTLGTGDMVFATGIGEPDVQIGEGGVGRYMGGLLGGALLAALAAVVCLLASFLGMAIARGRENA